MKLGDEDSDAHPTGSDDPVASAAIEEIRARIREADCISSIDDRARMADLLERWEERTLRTVEKHLNRAEREKVASKFPSDWKSLTYDNYPSKVRERCRVPLEPVLDELIHHPKEVLERCALEREKGQRGEDATEQPIGEAKANPRDSSLWDLIRNLRPKEAWATAVILVTVVGGVFHLGTMLAEHKLSRAENELRELETKMNEAKLERELEHRKQRFLEASATFLFFSTFQEEGLLWGRWRPQDFEARLGRARAFYVEQTRAVLGGENPLAQLMIDRDPGPARIVFTHDRSEWRIPEFALPD